jgi:peroxiredoxin (alkyl hydroperoxide reductase subunit C)
MSAFFPRAASRALSSAARPALRVHRPTVATFRRGLAVPAEGPRLRLGSVAPDFEAETTNGKIKFHEFLNGKWTILFSHPADFTPVCTTELGAFAKLKDEFDARGVQMLGLVRVASQVE